MSGGPSHKTIARIQADITTARADDMQNMGIHYHMDEIDITNGWALIFGPEDTPYEGGAYIFSVKFPKNYPFEPPEFKTLVQDGCTRFNPNMYRDGKVCLSLLNTWNIGDKWSSCQTLSAILLSIQTAVLCKNPLTREPSKENYGNSEESIIYDRMILHANLQTAVIGMIKNTPDFAVPFYDEISSYFNKKRERLVDLAVSMIEYDNVTEKMDFFRMTMTYKFSTLGDIIQELVPRGPFVNGGAGGGCTNTIY
jgi:ubiquitin-protein ligase